MTERELMLTGELYLAADPELTSLRQRARALTNAYNATGETQRDERTQILEQLFGSIGAGAEIETPFRCDYGVNIHVGERFYANFGCVILDCARVTIGDGVLLAPNVQLYAAYHPLDPELRRGGRELAAPITVGNNVWLGGGTIVLPGVTIGDDTVIGAGSVVTKSLPPRVVAVGNPCRVLREIP